MGPILSERSDQNDVPFIMRFDRTYDNIMAWYIWSAKVGKSIAFAYYSILKLAYATLK